MSTGKEIFVDSDWIMKGLKEKRQKFIDDLFNEVPDNKQKYYIVNDGKNYKIVTKNEVDFK